MKAKLGKAYCAPALIQRSAVQPKVSLRQCYTETIKFGHFDEAYLSKLSMPSHKLLVNVTVGGFLNQSA